MTYAQFKGGLKLHLVCLPGEEYRGEIVRYGYLSWPLCGVIPNNRRYRMTINAPLGEACKNCLRVEAAQLRRELAQP